MMELYSSRDSMTTDFAPVRVDNHDVLIRVHPVHEFGQGCTGIDETGGLGHSHIIAICG